MIEVFNYLSNLSFIFRNSYQGNVIKWLLIVYTIIIAINTALLAYRYPQIADYAIHGNKTKKRLAKQAKDKTRAVIPKEPWEKTKAKLNSVSPNDWKIAVIDADKLFDKTLKDSGTPGTTMGDRLKNIVDGDVGGNLNAIWEAHKVRNSIVHDSSFSLGNETARKSVKTFEDSAKLLEKK